MANSTQIEVIKTKYPNVPDTCIQNMGTDMDKTNKVVYGFYAGAIIGAVLLAKYLGRK